MAINRNNKSTANFSNTKLPTSSASDVHIIVPTIIDVPELIVTNEDNEFDDDENYKFDAHGSIWSDQMQFISSALSYTVSLGNIWRFPYLCYRHAGGAFLVAYTIMLIIIGLPLFLMELSFGQYANEGPIIIWRISPLFEGIGYSMCVISGLVAVYYNMINGWIVYYLFASISFSGVPWSHCSDEWSSKRCFKHDNGDCFKQAANQSLRAIMLNNGTCILSNQMNETHFNNLASLKENTVGSSQEYFQ